MSSGYKKSIPSYLLAKNAMNSIFQEKQSGKSVKHGLVFERNTL